jgi:uncharacterized protein YlzI (FlbEa/FlbD family)
MNILAEKYKFLSERFTTENNTEYLCDTDHVVMLSFNNNNYILTILGEFYIVTSNIEEITARLDDIKNQIKIQTNEQALLLRSIFNKK